ncbi:MULTISPECIES: hypothetical protein [unclassified Clostridium]|uniref:hypothetical protein n=1 Tax=unclassified Clostridium TaxID=2614128 RepID=UPI000297B3B9|nr:MULTISPECIES: hypothetical protein [unclassified Clostridium]EKQ58294.1 MAG: hypothetical protein A370_00009 [Clostridium sp. Maddingley MBC34-26]
MSISKFIISLFISIVLIMPTNAAFASQNFSPINNHINSTWLWDTSQIIKSSDKILNFLSSNNVKVLYLQIDYSIKSDVYRSFIKKASLKGISVHALNGSPDWLSDGGANKEKEFLDWLTKFQSTSSSNEKFKGIHLDIEPYLNKDYESNMNKVLENYQKSLLDALNNSNSLGVSLGIDIPFWFDGIKFNTKYGTDSLANWILKNINNVVIMAYRDKAEGNNGIIQVASKEMALGEQYGSKVTIAVETQKSVEGNFVSFYEEGNSYMNTELSKTYYVYKDNSSFGGFAIHHVISWMNLKK